MTEQNGFQIGLAHRLTARVPMIVCFVCVLAMVCIAKLNAPFVGAVGGSPRDIATKISAADANGAQSGDQTATTPPAQQNTAPKQESADKEEECSKPGQNYHDCLIQLRTTRATEQQASIAGWAAVLSLITMIFSAVAAAGAVIAAIHTKSQANTATAALVADNRPWVSISAVDAEFKIGRSPLFGITCINSGHSPAIKFRNNGKIWLAAKGSEPESMLSMDSVLEAKVNFLPPNFPVLIPLRDKTETIVITDTVLQQIESGNVALWLVVRLEYESIAHAKEPHSAVYKLRYVPKSKNFIFAYSHAT